jgi:hypothetical protein
MILKLKEILNNPFRDLKCNPLVEEKILALMESINLTGFWDNCVTRKNSQGLYELAYGHHRLAAAIRAGIKEADFIVKDLTDAQMIQVMDSENRETYGSSPQSILESVKAVVQCVAKGTITFNIDPKTNESTIRYAPSFVPGKASVGNSPTHPYTAKNIAEFLGRTQSKGEGKGEKADESVVAALNALHLQEIGHFSKDLLVTKDRTGASVPITTNELLKITRDIKRTVEREDHAKEDTRKAEQEALAENLRIEAERKAREKKAEAEYQESIRKEAEARKEKDKAEVERLRKERQDKAKALEEKKVLDKIRMFALETKLAEAKKKEEEIRSKNDYAPVRREVETLLFKLGTDPTWTEEAKALSRKKLTPEDAERVRQAALRRGSWYNETLSNLFLPALSVTKQLSEFKSREETKRRAEEAKKEKKKK